MVWHSGDLVGVEQIDDEGETMFSVYSVVLRPREQQAIRNELDALIKMRTAARQSEEAK
jgi:hypothetical protein